MKWILVIVNLLAAIALIFIGNFAVAAHRTHAYSVYRELQEQHVLVERPDYDIQQRLRTIANGGRYSFSIASIGASLCVANAAAIAFLWRRSKREG